MKTITRRGRMNSTSFRPRLERLEDRSLMTAGLLDTSFGGDGFVQTAIGSANDNATAVAVQADGKAVVGGGTVQPDGTTAFAVTRYNVDGSLDSSFGTGGKVVVSFGGSHNDQLYAIAIQPDGKLVAAGNDTLGGSSPQYNVAITRLNANGSLDTTFGDKLRNASTGKVLTPINPGNGAFAASIAFQSDGKIVVGGSARSTSTSSGDFAVYRYTTAGKLDTTFNSSGRRLTDFNGQGDQVYSVKIQPDGKIIAVGSASTPVPPTFADTALARYNSNGTLDTSFGVGGKETFDLSGGGVHDYAEALGIQPLPGGSFRLVTTGYAEIVDSSNPNGRRPILTVAGLTPSGNLDPTFANGGIAKTEAPIAPASGNGQVRYWWGNSLAIQADGKIVVGAEGRTTNFTDLVGFGMERYTPDGAVDPTFAGNGASFIDELNAAPINSGSWNSLALDTSGQIYVAGQINTNPSTSTGLDLLVARFTSDQSAVAPLAGTAVANDAALMLLLTDSSTTTTKRK